MGSFIRGNMMKRSIRKTITAESNAITDGWTWQDGHKEFMVGSEDFIALLDKDSVWAIRVESLSSAWEEGYWLDNGVRVRADIDVQMTLRKETRSGKDYWYAYRKRGGKQQKRFVGQSDKVTERKIVEVARKML